MARRATGITALVWLLVGLSSCSVGFNDDGAYDGTWLLIEAEVNGQDIAIDRSALLYVNGNDTSAQWPCTQPDDRPSLAAGASSTTETFRH